MIYNMLFAGNVAIAYIGHNIGGSVWVVGANIFSAALVAGMVINRGKE